MTTNYGKQGKGYREKRRLIVQLKEDIEDTTAQENLNTIKEHIMSKAE